MILFQSQSSFAPPPTCPPVGRFAKQVGAKALELFFSPAAKKHQDLLGDSWRSWRLGGFLGSNF